MTSSNGSIFHFTGHLCGEFTKACFCRCTDTDGLQSNCSIQSIFAIGSWFYVRSSLVQIMAWCHQATNHYLNQCWPRSMSSYDVTRPRWARQKEDSVDKINEWVQINNDTNKSASTQQIDGSEQECSNSSALAMESLQSRTKPSKWGYFQSHGPTATWN